MKKILMLVVGVVFAFFTTVSMANYHKSGGGWGDGFGSGGDGGYSDTQIDDNTFRIDYNGTHDIGTIENYMLYHAAEVASQNGFDYFIITDKQIASNKKHSSCDGDGCSESKKFSGTMTIEGYNQKPRTQQKVYDAEDILTNMNSAIRQKRSGF